MDQLSSTLKRAEGSSSSYSASTSPPFENTNGGVARLPTGEDNGNGNDTITATTDDNNDSEPQTAINEGVRFADEHDTSGMAAEEAKEQRGQRRILERHDCRDALEHIVAIGNHYRHRAWRRHTCQQQAPSQDGRDHEDEAAHPSNNFPQRRGANDAPMPPLHGENRQGESTIAVETVGGFHPDNNNNNVEMFEEDDDEFDAEEEEDIDWCAIHLLHAEDIRLYSTARGVPNVPWPPENFRNVHQGKPDMDRPWDQEYGDSIPLLDFSVDRLSQALPFKTAEEENDDNNDVSGHHQPFASCQETEKLLDATRIKQMDPDRVKCTVDQEDIPRAMLLRCWQRAVDIASFTTLQREDSEYASPPAACNVDFNNRVHSKDIAHLQQLQKPAAQRCAELPVDMYPWHTPKDPPFQCRLCGSEFSTLEQLRHHFHGSNDVRGCSWTAIQAKQRYMIAEALAKEVDIQVSGLVQLIMLKAHERIASKEAEPAKKRKAVEQPGTGTGTGTDRTKEDQPEQNQPFNWRDVLEMLQETVDSSQDCEVEGMDSGQRGGEVPEIRKTLKVKDGMAPLVLNKQVLEAASSWLTERYSATPK